MDAKSRGGLKLYLQLSLLALAGPLYIDVLPAMIAALSGDVGLTPKQAGAVASVNGYASTASALIAVVLLRRLPWRIAAAALLTVLITCDTASATIRDFHLLIGVRIVHGLAGGLLVGLSYGLIARTASRSEAFGILFVLHFGFAGVGVVLSTALGHYLGAGTIFMVTAAFSLLAMLSVVTLPDLPVQVAMDGVTSKPFAAWRERSRSIIAASIGLFVFQACNIGLGAFLIGIGQQLGHSADFAGLIIGGGLFAGALGSLSMLALSRRFSKILVALGGLCATGLVKTLLFAGSDPILYAVAVIGSYFAMSCALPLLYALIAEFDRSGEAAALSGFASKFGLSCGPLASAFIYGAGIDWLITTSIVGTFVACLLIAYSNGNTVRSEGSVSIRDVSVSPTRA
jgi:predicted MFS family arabinose efflux permease